jgi:hypothetical protein
MANTSKFAHFSMAIEAGVTNLHKWYGKTDDTDVYFICLGMYLISILMPLNITDLVGVVLDPNYKVMYTKDKWTTHFFKQGMQCLESMVRVTVTLFFSHSMLLFHSTMLPYHITSFSLTSFPPCCLHMPPLSLTHLDSLPWTFLSCTFTLGPCSLLLPI